MVTLARRVNDADPIASRLAILEKVTLADVVAGRMPASAKRLLRDPDAWVRR